MSSYPHILSDFQYIMCLTDQERIDFMEQPRWIPYPQANNILETLRSLMSKPSRPRMPNLVIIGDSNNGKTTIVNRFKELHGQAFIDDNIDPIKPVILAEAPPSAEEKGLYISILERFLTPYRASDPTSKLRYQVIHSLRRCKTKILIIDEMHSLLTGTPIKQREVMNSIKLLCNELAIPIIGVGTKETIRVLHMDPQHASRFDVVTLPTWELNHDFQRLLAAFEKILPLKLPSDLAHREKATLLFSISGGNLGDLHRLLVECAKHAIKSGTECINKEIIQTKTWIKPTRGIREIMI